jgi:two-component system cell cycle sensor histidine kinase/response regulator CckA
LLNLVVNARDALPVGGAVTLRTELAVTDANVDADAPQAPPMVRLTIADDGVGMSDEVMEHIFEPFFSTKAEGLGSGLGLATVYGIVEQAGGRIEVESKAGAGASFCIWLPMMSAPAGVQLVATTSTAAAAEVRSAGSTVLVVEDEELVRSLAARSLERAGLSVIEADSVASAVATASDPGQLIDLVITDVVLTDGRASQLVARLDELRPGVPVLHVSGYALDSMVQSGEMAEGVEFLAKPYRPAELVERAVAMLGADDADPDLGQRREEANRPVRRRE